MPPIKMISGMAYYIVPSTLSIAYQNVFTKKKKTYIEIKYLILYPYITGVLLANPSIKYRKRIYPL